MNTISAAPARGPFWAGLGVQSRVIGAMILRELHTRYGRENVGYLWMILEPMLLATVVGLFHLAAGHTAYGPDIKPMPFAVLGYTTFIVFRGVVSRAEGGVEANAPLLYHRMVTVIDITLARALLEAAGVAVTFVVLMTLLNMLGVAQPPARPLSLIIAWLYMFWFCLGQALIIVSITYENRTVGRLVHPYAYFMTFLSGAFYRVVWLPHWVQDLAAWLPTTSIFELARYGWFQSCDDQFVYYGYLTETCLILTWIGLVSARRLRQKIHLA
jgi:capsular polysaccharide transport system permease protein